MAKTPTISLVLWALTFAFVFSEAQDLSKYEYLNEPQMSEMPRQNRLVVETKGDPKNNYFFLRK